MPPAAVERGDLESTVVAELESMTAQHALKQAQMVLAQLQQARNDELFSRRLISTSDRDITKAAYDIAFADAASRAAQMKQAVAAVDTATANLGYLPARKAAHLDPIEALARD